MRKKTNIPTEPPRPRRQLVLLLTTVLVLMGASLPLRAEEDPDDQESDSATLQCREPPKNKAKAKHLAGDLFARAERAFDEKAYIKALKRFLCSMHTVEHEATLANIEEVVREIENRAYTVSLLEEFIAQNPDGELTPRITALVDELNQALAAENAEKQAKVAPETPVAPAAPPPICVSFTDPAPFISFSEAENHLSKLFGIVTMGTGSAVVVAGVVFQALAISFKSRADEADTLDVWVTNDKKSRGFQTGATVAFVAGAVTAGIGIAQFVIAHKRHKRLEALKNNPAEQEKCAAKKAPDKAPDAPDATVGIGPGAVVVTF